MNQISDQRTTFFFSGEERAILRGLFLKAVLPVAIAVVVSSIVLFFGFRSLIVNASFGNYGVNPHLYDLQVTRFMSVYTVIAGITLLLMIGLSVLVLYLTLHNIVLPVMRITREMKACRDGHSAKTIVVRKTDRLFLPLLQLINELQAKTYPK